MAVGLWASFNRWLDSRIGLSAVLRAEYTARLVPSPSSWARGLADNLGFVNLILLALLFLSGMGLVFKYQPTLGDAFNSILHIEHVAPGFWLLRRVHAVAANLLVLGCFLHLLRVVVDGAYKDPREMNWLSGFFLFLLGLAMLFTGYLLPMNQAGYWRVKAVTGWLAGAPWLGKWLASAARGGDDLGQAGLSLFYGLHISLPFALLFILALHLWLLRKTGVAEPI